MMTDMITEGTNYEAMRHAMVASQLRTNAVQDSRVTLAMDTIARERFVPQGVRNLAYRDTAVPLVNGRRLNNPIATGRLLTEAKLRGSDRVLLIGAATGYSALVLAQIVSHVTAVECDADLLATARETLAGDDRVELIHGDLAVGHPAHAPYDALIIDGAVEALPEALVAQVKPSGRIATGLVDRGVTRLSAGSRSTSGEGYGLADFVDSDCVVLPGFSKPSGFQF